MEKVDLQKIINDIFDNIQFTLNFDVEILKRQKYSWLCFKQSFSTKDKEQIINAIREEFNDKIYVRWRSNGDLEYKFIV